MEAWLARLLQSSLATVDVSAGLAHAMAVKDEEEVKNVKKAAFLASGVLAQFMVKEIEGEIWATRMDFGGGGGLEVEMADLWAWMSCVLGLHTVSPLPELWLASLHAPLLPFALRNDPPTPAYSCGSFRMMPQPISHHSPGSCRGHRQRGKGAPQQDCRGDRGNNPEPQQDQHQA